LLCFQLRYSGFELSLASLELFWVFHLQQKQAGNIIGVLAWLQSDSSSQ
jgi:hypothetical protein